MRIVIAISVGLLFVTASEAQTGTNCPPKTSLQLTLILDEIRKHIPDDHIVDLIAGCHVAFALDPTSLDRIVSAGASETVLAALDRDTISQMTLAQARSEVAAIENRKKLNEAASNSKRDAELRKLDTAFQLECNKPKLEFETTDQHKGRLATIQKEHDAARLDITAKYASDLDRQSGSLDRRIGAIKRGLFPVAGSPPVYVAYDADASRLAATVGGQEFLFSVEPGKASVLKTEWSLVKVMQRYSDQDRDERLIIGPSTSEPLLGRSKSSIQRDALDQQVLARLADAKKLFDSRSYEDAEAEYGRSLELDPNDALKHRQAAMEGIAASKKAIEEAQKRAVTVRQLREQLVRNPSSISGVWYDASSDLLWADRDDGRGVTWSEAKNYCGALATGGLSGWRLPSIKELEGIYSDATFKARTLGGGVTVHDHIKGEITLSFSTSWSGDLKNGNSAIAFSFITGERRALGIALDREIRALCARALDGPGLIPSIAPGSLTAKPATVSGTLLTVKGTPLSSTAQDSMFYLLLSEYPYGKSQAGEKPRPSGKNFEKALLDGCRKSGADCNRMVEGITAISSGKLIPDPEGNATFTNIPPGIYYLIVSGKFASDQKLHVSSWQLELKDGANSFSLPKSVH